MVTILETSTKFNTYKNAYPLLVVQYLLLIFLIWYLSTYLVFLILHHYGPVHSCVRAGIGCSMMKIMMCGVFIVCVVTLLSCAARFKRRTFISRKVSVHFFNVIIMLGDWFR